MQTIFVNYTDETKTAIDSVFAGPQDATFYKFQGQTTTSDPLYKTFYDAFYARMSPLIQRTLPEPTGATS